MSRPRLASSLFIGIHTVLMIFLTLYLMKLPWLAGDEKLLIWSTSALKLAHRELPPSGEFALINTSYDLALIDRTDEYGFPVGKQAITHRGRLARLLNILADSPAPPRYLILDIYFADPSPHDSLLATALARHSNLILSAHLDDSGKPQPPLFSGIPWGLSDYVIGNIFDGVYKYQLIHNDSLELTPLTVYRHLAGVQVEPHGALVKIGDRWTLNNFIMNYRVLQKDIGDLEAGFNPVNLGELLLLNDEDIRQFAAGKLVIIGDFFENDMHETLFEITSGPLILLNAYLTIKNGDTYVNGWFFLLLAVVYGYLSYMVVSQRDHLQVLIEKRIGRKKLAGYFAGFMGYLVPLTLLSVFTFFIFNIHINVFFLALAFYLMDALLRLGRKLIGRQRPATATRSPE